MKALRDFTVATLMAALPGWLLLGAGAIPFALAAGALVAWDNARRRQIVSGNSMK
jgi:hypothetical protein